MSLDMSLEAPMPRKADVPCSGCGTLTPTGPGSLPAGQQLCQPCRRARKHAEPDSLRPTACDYCAGPLVSKRRGNGRWARSCSRSCASRLRITEGTYPFPGRLARNTTGRNAR